MIKRRKKTETKPARSSEGTRARSSRKDLIIDSLLIMLVALLIGLAWQLYPDLSALIRRIIFVASLAVGGGFVVLRVKEIIQ